MAITKIRPRGRRKTNDQQRFFMTSRPGFTLLLNELEDHSVSEPDYETSAATKARNWRNSRTGKKVREQRTLKGEKILETMYEVNVPEGYITSPELLAVTRGDCPMSVFFWDPCEDSFTQVQNSIFDECRKRNTPLQTARDDSEPLTHYSRFGGYERDYQRVQFASQRANAGQALHAVAFQFPKCQNCDPVTHQYGVYAGASRLVATTTDQFANGSAITNAVPVGMIGTAVLPVGDVIYVAFADNVDPGTAANGGIVKIVNGVSTTVLTVAFGIYTLVQGEKYLWAGGKAGAIYRSQSGNTWTAVTNTVTPTAHFIDSAFEPKTGAILFAGHDGADGKAVMVMGAAITDISADVGTLTAIKLHCVKVLSEETDDFAHVAFGGDGGFYSENGDFSNPSSAFEEIANITTDAIGSIQGNSWRTFVGAASHIYQRAIYTEMEFAKATNTGDITGNITDGDTGLLDYGLDHVVFVTDSGNIVMMKPVVVDV